MLSGAHITLRPALKTERRLIFEWLTNSDLTRSMMGPPDYPELPVPTWEDFCADYVDHYFDDSAWKLGRCFVIVSDGQDVGQINYNKIQPDGSTEIDIWLSSSSHTGKGLGTDAIRTLCSYLKDTLHCNRCFIAPSLRNNRAIATYLKAGFEPIDNIPDWLMPEYADTLVMAADL